MNPKNGSKTPVHKTMKKGNPPIGRVFLLIKLPQS